MLCSQYRGLNPEHMGLVLERGCSPRLIVTLAYVVNDFNILVSKGAYPNAKLKVR